MNKIEYKVGDIIGYSTMDGTSLHLITDIDEFDTNVCLTTKLLMKPYLIKPTSNLEGSILLPQQEYYIRTKEEYFEEMQHEIDKKQNILNKLKEQYIK